MGRGLISLSRWRPGRYRVEVTLDGFEPASREIVIDLGQVAAADFTLEPARLSEARGRHRAAHRGSRAGSADPGVGRERQPGGRRRRLQRESAQGADSDRPVLLDQPAQLVDQHPRPRCAVRSDQRRHRAGRRPVHRRRVLCASGRRRRSTSSTSSGSRCCADRRARCSARTRRPARSTSRRASRRSRARPTSSSTTATSASCRPRRRSSGPLADKVAGRLSFSGTQRDGMVRNVVTGDDRERPQQPRRARSGAVRAVRPHWRSRWPSITRGSGRRATRRSSPAWRRRCATPNRQYAQIAADLGYTAPSFNAFDRVTDIDTPLRSNQDLGGASLNIDWKVGRGRLTSTTGWRYWNWDPSNDRDFIGLPVTTVSAAPSHAAAVDAGSSLRRRPRPTTSNVVVGAFAFHQALDSDPSFKQEQGAAAARFLLAPSAAAATPGLLDGYGFNQYLKFRNVSAAPFGQLEMARHRSAAGAARPAVQLRPEGRGLRSAGLRRPADHGSGADRAAALDPRAAGLRGRRRRHQPLGPAHRRVSTARRASTRYGDLRHGLQVGRPQSQRRAHRRAGSAGPVGGDGEARGRAARRVRRQDRAVPRRRPRTSRSTTPASRTSRRRS